MKFPRFSASPTSLFAGLLLVVLGLVAGIAIVEGGVRVRDRLKKGLPVLSNENPGPLTYDPDLGWAPRASYKSAGSRTTLHDKTYKVRFSQRESGLRVCSGGGSRAKILVVGDSYTEAWEASDDRQFYCVAAKQLGVQAHAFGAGGYGTLQERIALEKLLAAENPNLIVIQVCFNDFINNDYVLEKASWQNNHSMKRPYWESGRLVIRSPAHIPDWVQEFRLRSRLVSNLYDGYINDTATKAHSVEMDIEQSGGRIASFEAATVETRELFRQVKALTKGRPVICIAVDLRQPYLDVYRRMFSELGIVFVESAAEAVQSAEARGVDVFAHDGVHWNEAGHEIAGEALAQAIRTHSDLWNSLQ